MQFISKKAKKETQKISLENRIFNQVIRIIWKTIIEKIPSLQNNEQGFSLKVNWQ